MDKPEFTISVGIPATSSYQFSLSAGAKALQQNFFYLKDTNYKGHLILVTDKSDVSKYLIQYKELLGEKWTIHHIKLDLVDAKTKNYKQEATLTVDVLMNAIFCKARSLNSDYLFTNDSDVIVGHDVIEHCFHMIKTPKQYFDIITSPYPSSGGGGKNAGDFLSLGFGNSQNHIFPDIYPDERIIPDKYLKARELWDKEIRTCQNEKDKIKAEKLLKKLKWIDKKIESFPPKGNVHYLNSLGYRKRGWCSNAMSGTAARGNFAQTSWSGWGANLYSARALACLSSLPHGHLGGTLDLTVVHECLAPNNMNICSLPHCPSHHVIKEDKTGKLYLAYAYHEQIDKNTEGHLRFRMIPFYNFDENDRFTS